MLAKNAALLPKFSITNKLGVEAEVASGMDTITVI